MTSKYQQYLEEDRSTLGSFEGKSMLREDECVFKKCCKKYKKAGKSHCRKCPKR